MYLVPKIDEIKKRRIKAGLSKHQLSLKAGLGGVAICRIEKELTHKIHPLRAREIAHVLNCQVEDIFENNNKN